MQPVIKWSGSKRSQAQSITSYIPNKKYDTYFEPFCGGCSVLAYILEHENIANKFNNFICSDLNTDLIKSLNLIKFNPNEVIVGYEKRWKEMNEESNSIDDKKIYFNEIRTRLNKFHEPSDFIFIMRTTVNGMPRYNQNGDFNNAFHVTRDGINPNKFEKIVNEWNFLLNKFNVQFVNQSFEKINPSKDDLVYIDPPYANTKGMYFGGFNQISLFSFLERLESDWLMSYDGIAGNTQLTSEVPKNLFKRHVYINNGNSAFRRVVGKDKNCNVQESLYTNFELESQWLFEI